MNGGRDICLEIVVHALTSGTVQLNRRWFYSIDEWLQISQNNAWDYLIMS